MSAKFCEMEALDTWFSGLNSSDNVVCVSSSLFFFLAVTSTGVNVYYNRHTRPTHHPHPISLHYSAVYRFGLRGIDSYFRFHHFLFIIHGFHSDENNHISIQAFFSDFKYADKHYFVLCQAFGVFNKNRMGDSSK